MLVKYTPKRDIDRLVLAYWLLFLRCPSSPGPDVDGMYDLGTIDNPRMDGQRLDRETPYSVCKGAR